MESRDWRYGWASDDPRWTADSTTNGNGAAPYPDLWADYRPQAQHPPVSGSPVSGPPVPPPGPPIAGPPASGPPYSGPPYSRPSHPGPPPSGPSQYGPSQYGPPQYGPPRYGPPQYGPPISGSPIYGSNPTTTSTGGIPALRGPSGQYPIRPGYGPAPTPGFGLGRGVEPRSGRAADPRLIGPEPPFRPGRNPGRGPGRPPSGRRSPPAGPVIDEPGYGTVLGLTAGWYAVPAVVYLLWLITVGSGRSESGGGDLVGSLPWVIAAVLLSLAVAGLLRWAIVGWRALTLSFAAAVIGAGVATIAHSLSV